jgi:hypothetical protein
MQVMRRASAALTLLVVLAAGCGGDAIPVNSTSSPLGDGASGLQECIPDPSLTAMSEGTTFLDNHSQGVVIVEHVSLYDGHHIRFIQAVVVPIGYTAIGDVPWPPSGRSLAAGAQWSKRVPAAGARVPPSSGHRFRNVVIEVQPTARRATYAGVEVLYRENGHQYELRAHIATVIVPSTKAGC